MQHAPSPLIRFAVWMRSIFRERSGSQVPEVAPLSPPFPVAVVVAVLVEVVVLVLIRVATEDARSEPDRHPSVPRRVALG